MRRFVLYRDVDVSGYSGTGIVVEGIQFTDGSCAMRWRSDKRSTVVWDNLEDLIDVHGHDGATRLVWVDQESPSDWLLRTLGRGEVVLTTRYDTYRNAVPFNQPPLPGLENLA